MAITIVIVLLVIGSLVFHFASPWWFTPLASNWQSIDDTINIALWVTGIVFVLVNLFLAYVVYKYRFNKNRKADYEPENKKLEGWLTVVTSAGVAAMLIPGLFVWADIIEPPEDSHIVEIVAQQWHWTYRFPGDDGQLGKTAIEFITEANPFGMDESDPAGLDDYLIASNELHLPVNKPVKLVLRSKDVLHNFAVPQFRVKMDLVPGLMTYVWFTPSRVGSYDILCEELCGVAHFTMRGRVMVDEQAVFDNWLRGQETYASIMAKPPLDYEKGKSLYAGCAACHGVDGEGNEAMKAPRLAGLSKWYLSRQLKYFRDKVRGGSDEDVPGQQMAAMSVLLPDDYAIEQVAGYLASLNKPEIKTISIPSPQVTNGNELYQTCASCHGQKAEGNFATNAPRLAGQHPWYLKRQIQNYQLGIRGRHLRDLYGSQMMMMSRVLQDEKAIDAVVTHIDSLSEQGKQIDSVQGAGHE